MNLSVAPGVKDASGTGRFLASEWRRTAMVMAVLLLGLGLRLWGLDAKSLWQDEIFTAAIASPKNSLYEVASISLYNTALPAPPLYFLITHFLLRVVDNDFLLRFPALAFGVLGVAATYTVGARLFGKTEGVVGALLLALAPLHIRYSQDARFYTLLVLLALLSVYFLGRGLRSGERRWFVGFALCSILNLYNHLFAFLVLGAQVLWVVGRGVREVVTNSRRARASETKPSGSTPALGRRVALAFAVSLAIIALAYLPMAPHLLRGLGGGKGLGGTAGGLDMTLSLVLPALDSWGLGSGWRILLLFVPFALGVIVSARGHRGPLWLGICWLVAPLVVLLVVPAKHGFRPRYVLFMLPLYLCFAARGLTAVDDLVARRLAEGRRRLSGLALAVLVGVVVAFCLPAIQDYYREDRANWRAVASLVAERIAPGDVIVSPGPFPQVVMPRYETSLTETTFIIGGSEVFLLPDEERHGGAWFVGPAREKMRAIDEELAAEVSFFFKAALEVDDESAERGRALKLAPVMYDDLWVLYAKDGLLPEDIEQLHNVPTLVCEAKVLLDRSKKVCHTCEEPIVPQQPGFVK